MFSLFTYYEMILINFRYLIMSIEKKKLTVSLKNDGKSYGEIANFMNITRNSATQKIPE